MPLLLPTHEIMSSIWHVPGDSAAQNTGCRLYQGLETTDALIGAIGVLATALANVLVVLGKDVALQMLVYVIVAPGGNRRVAFAPIQGVRLLEHVIGRIGGNSPAANVGMRLGEGLSAADAFGGTKRGIAHARAAVLIKFR